MLPSAANATVLEVSIEEAQNDEQVAVEMVDEEEKSYQVLFTFQAGRFLLSLSFHTLLDEIVSDKSDEMFCE